MKLHATIAAAVLSLWCTAGAADWTLDASQSKLSFVSIKKQHVGEVHSFGTLQGSIEQSGEAQLVVDLATVNTNIAIRDERMREFLFEIDRYPQATYTVHLDPGALNAALQAESGGQTIITLEGQLEIHGVKKGLPASAFITKTGPNSVVVSSAHPVIVKAADFGLVPGLDKLQALAKLPSIGHAVPVSFHLVFRAE